MHLPTTSLCFSLLDLFNLSHLYCYLYPLLLVERMRSPSSLSPSLK